MESTSTPPTQLANRLSSSVPQYLVNLAHEPSIGLHFAATHAQQRAAPTIAKLSNHVEHRTSNLSGLTLDVRDANTMLETQVADAQKTLDSISTMLNEISAALHVDRSPVLSEGLQ